MHLFITRLKCLLRNKSLIFWTLLFPIVLSIFFNLAFSNLTSFESFNTINVSVVLNEQLSNDLLNTLETVEYTEGKKMFKVYKGTKEEAIELLNGKSTNPNYKNVTVSGYIEVDQDDVIHVTFRGSGINETIIKTFLDEYVQIQASVISITIHATSNIDLHDLIADLSAQENFLVENNKTSSPNFMLIYFYALLGMALIYGGVWGTNEIINLQANQSSKGIRLSVSPTKRMRLLLTNMASAYVIHMCEILIFLLFLYKVLNVSFGDDLLFIIIYSALSSFTGISFGAFTAISLKKASEGLKVAITSITGVLGGFLSGMMYANIKYWINTNFPIIGYINPVNVIADGFYSLYYYPTYERFFTNVIILSIMCLVFVLGIYFNFRRDNYESV